MPRNAFGVPTAILRSIYRYSAIGVSGAFVYVGAFGPLLRSGRFKFRVMHLAVPSNSNSSIDTAVEANTTASGVGVCLSAISVDR